MLQVVQEADESVHTSSNESMPLGLGASLSDGLEGQQGIMQQVYCRLGPPELSAVMWTACSLSLPACAC